MRSKFKFTYLYFECRLWNYLGLIFLLGLMGGCATAGKDMIRAGVSCLADPSSEKEELPPEAFKNADDLLTVDCLLPGQLIQIGMHQQWMSPPRPAIITAWECKVQGGQYAKTSDKDGRETALSIWEGCANQGDKEAQNYMGEIYGRSWGIIKPDYVQAAKWYSKSAEQGYSRAQNNLGFLYENGLGVQKNKQLALDLYRQAMGAVESIKLDQHIKNEINELKFKLDQALQTTKFLRKQLNESEAIAQRQLVEIKHLKQIHGASADQQAQLKKVQNELTQTRNQEKALRKQLAEAQLRLTTADNHLAKTETQLAFKHIPDTGKYYALIIGINNYQSPLEDLQTPINDAKRVDEVLRKKYGFETTLITDDGPIEPTREAIILALYDLEKKIKDGDNLLIYYAGHGELSRDRAHWLPQNAHAEIDANWLSTDDITKKIEFRFAGEGIKARHVLIVADSCYSAAMITSWLAPSPEQKVAKLPNGMVTRSSHPLHVNSSQSTTTTPPPPDGLSAEERIGWVKAKHKSISRKELTSGGLEPVLDKAFKNGLSVFANAFTEALEANEEIIGAYEIYAQIGPQVVEQVKVLGMNQTPVYAPIPKTGDNHGEFFFIPR